MKSLFLVLVLVGFGAIAQEGPQIEPGPVVQISDGGVSAVDALTHAKSKDLNAFIKLGNATTEVTRQNTKPGTTQWKFTRKQCMLGGFTGGRCLGGGVLTVTLTHIQQGSGVTLQATSSLVRFRE
jgi:hypothetical protein